MNEAETRADHIDPALKAAGWGVAQWLDLMRTLSVVGSPFGKTHPSCWFRAEFARYHHSRRPK